MSDCVWAFVLPLVGPLLAFLYDVAVLIFLASFGEITWGSKISSLLLRLALLAASIAVGVGLCEGEAPLLSATLSVSAVLLILSIYLIIRTRRDDISGPVPHLPSMKGKVAIVTGANTGIGKETARLLAQQGATVVLACRNENKALQAMEDIEQAIWRSEQVRLPRDQLRFLPLDLSDLASVRRAAAQFQETNLPLDVLINNAGLMTAKRTITKDGHELCFQANHLGHYLLTRLLLPKLQETQGRILNLSSITYTYAEYFDFDDIRCENRKYTLFGQYAQSKLCNVLFTKELARRYPTIQSFAVNPGIVRTDVTRNMPVVLRVGNFTCGVVVSWFQKTPQQGAYTSVWAACCEVGPNGSFLANSRVAETNDYAKNEDDAKILWKVSADLVAFKQES
jgi:NAD(P)-dependent dehydrogenase (short-subunit alcohol dehydrogenase family)